MTDLAQRFDWYIPDELIDEMTPEEIGAYSAFIDAELEQEALGDMARQLATYEADWRSWLMGIFGRSVTTSEFGPHHEEFWRWAWAIEAGKSADPFVAVWARGGAKSSSAELACVALGARGKRSYVLYVSGVQDLADDHVTTIGSLLEHPGVERLYPDLATRAVGKFGNSRGWRRNRLWTQAGLIVDAIGLDTAARGVKLDTLRPDMIILDDIDTELDSPDVVDKKITTLTRKLLPAGAGHAVVLAIQNLVHPNSVFARLVDGRAEFLQRRIVSGPVPAVRDLAVEERDGATVIVGGEPTWAGQDLEACQRFIDQWGITSFRAEAQHEVTAPPGGMFNHLSYRHCAPDAVPDLERVVVWVDPAVTDTDSSDSMGIQVDGIADGIVYRLRSWEQRATPLAALTLAIRWAFELGAEHVGVETDQGGDTWASVYREALAAVLADFPDFADRPVPGFASAKAGAGHGPKTHRASKMLVDYEVSPPRFVHVLGTHEVLEAALGRFPKTKPLDLTDACYWSWRDLVPERKRRRLRYDAEAA